MLGVDAGIHFAYSLGWLEKFKGRYNLKQYHFIVLSGSVSKELIQESRKKAQEIIKLKLSNVLCRNIDDV